MEDRQGDVGSGSVTISKSLSGKLASELPVEKTGGNSLVEDSREEGDGGEVMVEVVGSEVFVDGVSGQKEGRVGFEGVVDLEGNVEKNGEESGVKAMGVLDEGDGNKSGGNEVGGEGLKGEQNCNVCKSEGVDAGIEESVDVGDGVGDGKERFVGDGVVGALESNAGKNGEEIGVSAMDVLDEGDGHSNVVAMEEVDVGFRGSVDSGGGREGFVRSEEVRDLENAAGKNGEETGVNSMDVSSEGNGNKTGESELRVEGLRGDEDNCIVTNEVSVGISGSVGVGDGAVSKSHSEGIGVLYSEVSTNTGSEAVILLPSAVTETVSGQTEEVTDGNHEVTHEEKVMENEAVDKSGADLVTSEHLNPPMEALGEQKIGTAEKEELISSNDSAAGCDHSGADSLTTHGTTDAAGRTQGATSEYSLNSNCSSVDNTKIGGIDVVEESGLVIGTKGEALDTGNPTDGVLLESMEVVSSHSDCGTETKFVDEKVLAVDSEDSICKTHPIGVQDENQVSLKESHGITSEPNHGIEDTPHNVLSADGNMESDTKYDGMEVDCMEPQLGTEQIDSEMVASEKHDGPELGSCSREERKFMELVSDGEFYPDNIDDELFAEDLGKSVSTSSGMKQKALDALDDGSAKKLTIAAAKLSSPTSKPPKPSFKIGECIRIVASQLTAPMPLVKENNDEKVFDGSPNISELSTNEILCQLELLALNRKKWPNLQGNVHSFFLGFRSSIALNRRGRKRKTDQSVGGSGDEFEFDEVTDSYWMDRIVHNYPAEQLLHDGQNGGGSLPLVPFGEGKRVKTGRKLYSRKRYSTGNHPTETSESDDIIKLQKQQSSPAELILNFAEKGRVPSEINLNKMFRRFGSLMESETEVDHESGRAKVIFKRGSDAEVAHNSAEKFKIFGPVPVNYEIGYSPVISVKILPVAIPQLQEDEVLMI